MKNKKLLNFSFRTDLSANLKSIIGYPVEELEKKGTISLIAELANQLWIPFDFHLSENFRSLIFRDLSKLIRKKL